MHQANWVISRKELEAAKICNALMSQATESIRHINRITHFWTDSMAVLGWISNPDLKLARFLKRWVDSILCAAPNEALKYVNTIGGHKSVNPLITKLTFSLTR